MPSELALDVPVMLLAAGRGERMRPLTDTTPKPLLPVRGKPLMQWRMEALLQSGFHHGVINTAWLGEQIEVRFGDSFALPQDAQAVMQLAYSREGQDFGGALETAGGICRALPLLGDVFWAMAGDVFAPDFVFAQEDVDAFMRSDRLAHIWLVPNPDHNPAGDFGFDSSTGLALNSPKDGPEQRYTFSTIGLYRKELFLQPWCTVPPGNPAGEKAALAPLLRLAMDQQRVGAALYTGAWTDVGTPQRLALLNN